LYCIWHTKILNCLGEFYCYAWMVAMIMVNVNCLAHSSGIYANWIASHCMGKLSSTLKFQFQSQSFLFRYNRYRTTSYIVLIRDFPGFINEVDIRLDDHSKSTCRRTNRFFILWVLSTHGNKNGLCLMMCARIFAAVHRNILWK